MNLEIGIKVQKYYNNYTGIKIDDKNDEILTLVLNQILEIIITRYRIKN